MSERTAIRYIPFASDNEELKKAGVAYFGEQGSKLSTLREDAPPREMAKLVYSPFRVPRLAPFDKKGEEAALRKIPFLPTRLEGEWELESLSKKHWLIHALMQHGVRRQDLIDRGVPIGDPKAEKEYRSKWSKQLLDRCKAWTMLHGGISVDRTWLHMGKLNNRIVRVFEGVIDVPERSRAPITLEQLLFNTTWTLDLQGGFMFPPWAPEHKLALPVPSSELPEGMPRHDSLLQLLSMRLGLDVSNAPLLSTMIQRHPALPRTVGPHCTRDWTPDPFPGLSTSRLIPTTSTIPSGHGRIPPPGQASPTGRDSYGNLPRQGTYGMHERSFAGAHQEPRQHPPHPSLSATQHPASTSGNSMQHPSTAYGHPGQRPQSTYGMLSQQHSQGTAPSSSSDPYAQQAPRPGYEPSFSSYANAQRVPQSEYGPSSFQGGAVLQSTANTSQRLPTALPVIDDQLSRLRAMRVSEQSHQGGHPATAGPLQRRRTAEEFEEEDHDDDLYSQPKPSSSTQHKKPRGGGLS